MLNFDTNDLLPRKIKGQKVYQIAAFSFFLFVKNRSDVRKISNATKKKRALTLKSPAIEIQIYDKALESNNRQLYTRVEIRFKNIRDADIYSLAERLHKLIDSLSVVIKKVEKQKIDYLYQI